MKKLGKTAQYNLDSQTTKTSSLLPENVSNALPEKELLENAAGLKRSKYSAISKELKKQTSI